MYFNVFMHVFNVFFIKVKNLVSMFLFANECFNIYVEKCGYAVCR